MNDIKLFGDKARATNPGDLFVATKGSIEGHDIATLKQVIPTKSCSLQEIVEELLYLIYKSNLPETTLRQLHKIAFERMALELDESAFKPVSKIGNGNENFGQFLDRMGKKAAETIP